ncbi:MAG TPA: CHAT domain-containing protein [Ktedonobacteraceae bacterium]|nr:CHAT domain-containing protein [Ktedonobacteraceae bacterium]
MDVLELSITLTSPPSDAPANCLASLVLSCETLELSCEGIFLPDPLTRQERNDLRWYLEEYWLWPYEGFAQRGKEVEALLTDVGKRMYRIVFGSTQALSVLQACCSQPDQPLQISIVSDIPSALSLPWELLHDEEYFLTLRHRHPISIVRRLPLSKQSERETTFTPPLRILLITAQPEGTGFVDPRSIARELLDELGGQIEAGVIELEFLRPPTLSALQTRLKKRRRPIHILHFDGHGTFGLGTVKQGMLAFEDQEGQLDPVTAEALATVLRDSGVRLVVLTACQSAMSSEEDLFSSIAAQLVSCGIDAVVAMSANVLVTSATRYAEAFYHALAAGISVSMAHEQARQALHDDPRRHFHHRRRDEEGMPVELRDWWMPHLYLQHPVLLQPDRPVQRRKRLRTSSSLSRMNEDMPGEPRYGFSGRARELLRLERWLLQGKVVLLSGFGGIGKTSLARETASWLTHTKMYDAACFVSFEHGGDAALLLSALGHFLGVYDSSYDPNEIKTAFARLETAFKKKRTLIIADNLESILPEGEAPLEPELRSQLRSLILALAKMGAGVLLTSRDGTFTKEAAPGSQVAHLSLQGLRPHDAYILATHLLHRLGIDPLRAPYTELRNLLSQLDHHPLAIQLVLPTLRDMPISVIRTEFSMLLPKFLDEGETGHNRSLLASLDYSLRRLSEEQRGLLPQLVLFVGGAIEDNLLAITRIPEDAWAKLRQALEQSALLRVKRVHRDSSVVFLQFHPVLMPFLRRGLEIVDATLFGRYMQRYYDQARFLYTEDKSSPEAVRVQVLYELPNFRQTLDFLLQTEEWEAASYLSICLTEFLEKLGFWRERTELRRKVVAALATETQENPLLTEAEWLYESGRGDDEYQNGDILAALARFQSLLVRIEALSEDVPFGRNSYQHCVTLHRLARCFKTNQQPDVAEEKLNKALTIIDALISRQPDYRLYLRQKSLLLGEMGDIALLQGHYPQAREAYEAALAIVTPLRDTHAQAVLMGQLGILASEQRRYAEARLHLATAQEIFHTLNEPGTEANIWYQLGRVAEEQDEWDEARRCYRESLSLDEQLGNLTGVVNTCNQLALVAHYADRPTEAESWYKRAMELEEQMRSSDHLYATLLNNLANLLLSEVWERRAPLSRLAEARAYAERALALEEGFSNSSEVWTTLYILAVIASMEGQVEKAQAYHRREREAFAAFPGNRYHIERQLGSLIAAVATAMDNPDMRAVVEEALQRIEAKGWHITTAVHRIWEGERDWHLLAEGLDRQDALVVLRILETLTSSAGPQPVGEQDKV